LLFGGAGPAQEEKMREPLHHFKKPFWWKSVSSETMHQIVAMIEAEAKLRPSAIEFEMAYQIRIAIERIRFAIQHVEQFAKPCHQVREAGMQLLDALDRLQAVDRRFQIRSRRSSDNGNGHQGLSIRDRAV
jgi:hypothetical protein